MKFRASRWGGLLSWTKFIMPDTIDVGDARVTVIKRKLFGLSNTEEEMAYTRVASVRVKNGLFFSDIVIETTGGATADISIRTLKKKVAKSCAGEIRDRVA